MVMIERVSDAVEGSSSGWFAVTRTGDKTNALTVSFSVSGTATVGTDYTDFGTSVTIEANAVVAFIEVAALPDGTYDPDETVVATLQSGTGYSLDAKTRRRSPSRTPCRKSPVEDRRHHRRRKPWHDPLHANRTNRPALDRGLHV